MFWFTSSFKVKVGQDFSNVRCRLMVWTLVLHKLHLDVHQTSSFAHVLGFHIVSDSSDVRPCQYRKRHFHSYLPIKIFSHRSFHIVLNSLKGPWKTDGSWFLLQQSHPRACWDKRERESEGAAYIGITWSSFHVCLQSVSRSGWTSAAPLRGCGDEACVHKPRSHSWFSKWRHGNEWSVIAAD